MNENGDSKEPFQFFFRVLTEREIRGKKKCIKRFLEKLFFGLFDVETLNNFFLIQGII